MNRKPSGGAATKYPPKATWVPPTAAETAESPLLGIIGVAGHGGPSNGAVNHDHYVYGASKKA